MNSMNRLRLALARRQHRHPDGLAVLEKIDPTKTDIRLTSFEHLLDDDAFNRLVDRILGRVEFHPAGCWLMQGGHDINGYHLLHFDGQRYSSVCRVICSLVYGPMVKQHDTRHWQGYVDRNCVNPEHLQPGSRRDNMRDGRDKTVDYHDAYGQSNRDRRRKSRARKAGALTSPTTPTTI
jgi:hypothetical protein